MNVTIQCEATGVDISTGDPRVRKFHSFTEWVNKASSWMRPGYTLVDMDGRIVRNGADARAAKYPVSIYRLLGPAE